MDNPLTGLHRFIVERYNLEELRTLCFYLGVDYGALDAETKSGAARELILHLGAVGQLDRLLEQLERDRPGLLTRDGIRADDPDTLEGLYAALPRAGESAAAPPVAETVSAGEEGAPEAPPETGALAALHRFLVERYNLEELRTLCFDLAVDYDELRGETLSGKARELIRYVGAERRLDELLAYLDRDRPGLLAGSGLDPGDRSTLAGLYAALPDAAASRGDGTPLEEFIVRHYNLDELRTLCFILNVDYDSLPGEIKSEKAAALVGFLERRGQLDALLAQLQQERPIPFATSGLAVGEAGAAEDALRSGAQDVPGQVSRQGGEAISLPYQITVTRAAGVPAEVVPQEPYKGPAPYTTDDAPIFFGRDVEVERLAGLLAEGRWVLLYGEAGVGKSSLLQAGLTPRLLDTSVEEVVIQLHSPSLSVDALRDALVPGLSDPALGEAGGVLELFQASAAVRGGHVTLILDQLEELFTLAQEEPRRAFLGELAALRQAEDLPVRVVASIRDAFLGQLAMQLDGLDGVFDAQVALGRLTRDAARQAIVAPLKVAGFVMELELVDRIVADLSEPEQEEILPLDLQLVCLALYREAMALEPPIITRRIYVRLGGAHGVLDRARYQLRAFVPGHQQDLALAALSALSAGGNLRLDELATQLSVSLDELDSILGRLVEQRLVVGTSSPAGEPTFRLGSDLLVDRVLRSVPAEPATEMLVDVDSGSLPDDVDGLLAALKQNAPPGRLRRLLSRGDTEERQAVKAAWRAAIARKLGGLGDPRAVAPLIEQLGDPETGPRVAAAEALGMLGDPRASPALESALEDPDEKVYEAAQRALTQIGGTVVHLPGALAERFDVVAKLGEGGLSEVYRVWDRSLGRAALRLPKAQLVEQPGFADRFLQEARLAARLEYPNIARVLDFGVAGEQPYLVAELVGEGRALRDLLEGRGRLLPDEALPLLEQVAAALDYLHGQEPPLLCYDLKPSNILLEGEGAGRRAALADFVVLRAMVGGGDQDALVGTPAYTAPERTGMTADDEVGPYTDRYNLGLVAYEILCGRRPFVGGGAISLLHAHAEEPPPSPLEAVPELGEAAAAVLLRALSKKPAERYPSAGAFVTALREALAAPAATSAEEFETEPDGSARLVFNGIDASTGTYALPPLEVARFYEMIVGGRTRDQGATVQRS
jgi:hypothetical protein